MLRKAGGGGGGGGMIWNSVLFGDAQTFNYFICFNCSRVHVYVGAFVQKRETGEGGAKLLAVPSFLRGILWPPSFSTSLILQKEGNFFLAIY